jgi:uncharacterized protein (TIGR00106 family)
MTLMELTMIPLDKGPGLSSFVAKVVNVIDNSGLDYRLTPMGTVVEGEWSELTALLDRCFATAKDQSDRISISLKFDYRKGSVDRLTGKIRSVEEKIGRKLRTIEDFRQSKTETAED